MLEIEKITPYKLSGGLFMKYVSTNTYWNSINKVPKTYPYLSEDIECDVVVIGAGITGASCAYYFAEAGINTVIVDKNIVGYGSTRASTSILQYEIDSNILGLKGTIGIDKAVDAFKLCKKALYDIESIVKNMDEDCSFGIHDCLYYAYEYADVNMIKEEYELRKQNGFEVELILEENAKERFPFLIKAGIYSKDLAGEVDPYRLTHALISSSEKRGLRIFENTEIIDIKEFEDYKILMTKNEFKIKAKKIIIAQGYESRKYIDKKIATLTRTFTIVTEPISKIQEWYNKCIIRDTNSLYTYLRPTQDNRIIIGGEDLDVGGENSKMSNLSNDDPVAIEKYNMLEQKLKTFFPSIKDAKIEYKFSGVFGDTKDSLPYFGEYKDNSGIYFNLSYGANGILYAIIGAQLLRDLYLGNRRPELGLFSFDR
jgi:glycine/D-amino acid oxidase-like deaminating enzyme